MARCKDCRLEMLTARGCKKAKMFKHGRLRNRIRWGDEKWGSSAAGRERAVLKRRCGDCGCLPGYYHHNNCDIERCPVCGKQAMSNFCETFTMKGRVRLHKAKRSVARGKGRRKAA